MKPALALAVALLGCQVPDLDLAGRPCPCIAGYACDPATQTCVRGAVTASSASASSSTGSGGGSGGSGASGTGTGTGTGTGGVGGMGAGGTGGVAGGSILFADEFDTETGQWQVGGAGMWAVVNGEMQQTVPAGLAYDFVPAFANLTDYHIESRMRQISGSAGGAMEIDFRISASMPDNQYFCNWEPNDGNFLVMISTAGFAAYDIKLINIDVTAIPGYDPLAPVTMQIDVVGNEIHCWLDEIAGANITVSDPSYPTGAFGLKNYAMATAYDYIRVSTPP